MGSRMRLKLFAATSGVAAIAVVGPWPARAVVEDDQEVPGVEAAGAAAVPETTTTTLAVTTTAPPATTTTTKTPAPARAAEPAGPASAPPRGPSAPAAAPGPVAPAAPPGPDPGPLPPGGGDGTEVPPDHREPFPASLQALMASVDRSGASDTRGLLRALEPLQQYGLTPEQAAQVGFGRFPVGGEATYTHDWWFPRFGPGWRLHEGTDIFAAAGTPVRAPAPGRARISNGGLGGLAVYVVEPDGTYYYLAHLAGIAPDLVDGIEVATGQIVGYVGDSGNARGGTPHLHFEVHPGGGGPVDPKPVLDGFLAEALDAAPGIVEHHARLAADGGLPPSPPARPVRLPALVGPPRAALLWASAASPAGGALRLAEAEAFRAASALAGGRVSALTARPWRTSSAEPASRWPGRQGGGWRTSGQA